MNIELTAATGRAIDEASNWSVDGSISLIQAPSVLLGLLSEPECRAAQVLNGHGIDAEAIHARWSSLSRVGSSGSAGSSASYNEGDWDELVPHFSSEMEVAIAIAKDWLGSLPRPFTLATEHLLMGMTACDHEGWTLASSP